jgi:maleamate amidohydrolase
MTQTPINLDASAAPEDGIDRILPASLPAGIRPALVIVDPVVAYIDPACGLYAGVEEAVDNMRAVLAKAHTHGIPVFITTVRYTEDGSNGGVFWRKVPLLRSFTPSNPFGEFIEGLAPTGSDRLVIKQYPSAFFGTGLVEQLAAEGVDTVVITGLSTSGCIRATALDTMQYGFVPIVVRDAVGDRHAHVHEANLYDIATKIGEVWDSAAVFDYFASLAGH